MGLCVCVLCVCVCVCACANESVRECVSAWVHVCMRVRACTCVSGHQQRNSAKQCRGPTNSRIHHVLHACVRVRCATPSPPPSPASLLSMCMCMYVRVSLSA